MGILVAPEASVPSGGKFISGMGAGHLSTHSLLAGVRVGVMRAGKESASFHGVWGLIPSLMRVCLSSAPRCVRNPSERLAGSLRPQRVLGAPAVAGARRAGPCCGARGGAASAGSAPCEAAGDAPGTVNSAALQDILSLGHTRLCGR